MTQVAVAHDQPHTSAPAGEVSKSVRRIWAVYKRHAYGLRHSIPGQRGRSTVRSAVKPALSSA